MKDTPFLESQTFLGIRKWAEIDRTSETMGQRLVKSWEKENKLKQSDFCEGSQIDKIKKKLNKKGLGKIKKFNMNFEIQRKRVTKEH